MNKEVARDKILPHACEIVRLTEEIIDIERAVEDGFLRIRDRAMKSDMVILSIGHSVSVIEKNLTLVMIVAHWASREQIEAVQRQQQLLHPNGLRKV